MQHNMANRMFYFAYGSNMSIRRLCQRVPSARLVSVARLENHELRFHKKGFRDGSGKCDAYATGNTEHTVIGVVFDISIEEKNDLDRVEGLGAGYEAKTVQVASSTGEAILATTYYATHIDFTLQPFHWYKEHVMRGVREHSLPESYAQTISGVESIVDPDSHRHAIEMAMYC